MRLQSKVALVTGSARGIGAGIAAVFAREGAAVMLSDVLEDEGEAHAERLRQEGGNAAFIKLDVVSEDDWQRAHDAILRTFGKWDVLVNNAGGGGGAGPTSYAGGRVEDFQRVMDVNATSTYIGIRTAVPAMIAAGGGSIVNISSVRGIVGGIIGEPGPSTAYHAAKGAIRVMTKTAAIELAPRNIRVNSIHPGIIGSHGVMANLSPAAFERHAAVTPLDRIGTPEDIGYGALYLASDESRFVTGAELVIDGGWAAH